MPQIIQTAPTSAAGANAQSVDALIDQIARLLGQPTDLEARQVAADALDAAARRMNIAGIWMSRLTEATYANATGGGSGATLLTNEQRTLTLPSDWGWAYGIPQIYNSDNDMVGNMGWLSWDDFLNYRATRLSTDEQVPEVLSIRNEHDGTAEVYPPIDTTSMQTLIVPYLARIQVPSSTGVIYLTEQAREALRTGGIAFAMQYQHRDQPEIWRPYVSDFNRVLQAAIGADNRREDSYWLQWRAAEGADRVGK